ncbi:MAG: hypothetical protein ACO2ZZ_04935 [Cyclobacteriaceae bacterium]
MTISNQKAEKVCTEAKEKMIALGIEEQLVSEIEWCLGSYAADGNPQGLFEKAGEAFSALQTFKKENPRKVTKKLIDELEKVSA